LVQTTPAERFSDALYIRLDTAETTTYTTGRRIGVATVNLVLPSVRISVSTEVHMNQVIKLALMAGMVLAGRVPSFSESVGS